MTMRDLPLYVDAHADAIDDFWGSGAPPSSLYTATRRCEAGCGSKVRPETMRVRVSPIKMGRPPISTWSWLCAVCRREKFGGRWREED